MAFTPLPARALRCAALLALALVAAVPAAGKIRILAAENVYGAVAQAIAGPAAEVSSVLRNPAVDPHDFEPNAGVARLVSGADIVVLNGLDYDPWMDRLIGASERPGRVVLRVADLVGARAGDNPHLWYAPRSMALFAVALTAALVARDAAEGPAFTGREKSFLAKLALVQAQIEDMKKQYAGQPVTATEPIFGSMAACLGLSMHDTRFQFAVMNGTEPRAGDIVAIEDELRGHRVRVLFHNAQVSDAASDRLIFIARAAGVPVVGVAETMPPDSDYPDWMLHTLAVARSALGARR